MGGRVGLKGTNGADIVAKALELGAKPVSPLRAVETLLALKSSGVKFELITYPDEMGAKEAAEAGFEARVIGEITPGKTTAEDTKRAVMEMSELGVDLILVAGGDGTMRDVIEAVGTRVPVLGIPTGVKMHSAAFANTPKAAGQIAARFLSEGLPLQEAEVMDIDEDAYRENRLVAKLMGYALVPYEPLMIQTTKEGSAGFELADQKAIARWAIELMERGRVYILGPGTTTRAVAEELGIYNSTLLGVDLIQDFKLLARDVNEKQILELIEGNPAAIIVSPIGKQGFIFGRGNQQLSPAVIRKVGKKNIIVLATPHKLSLTPILKVDTGDPELDEDLRGYTPVIVGYLQTRMVKVI
jgi:predicted polyphosphate/ATP-dependent NAD kinase